MVCTVIVDGFFGDSGKGKIVSYLAYADDVDYCARGGVGPNAGHTVTLRGRVFRLRMLPSAFVNPETRLLIGPGVVVNPEIVLREISELEVAGFNVEKRFGLDAQCAVIEPRHIEADRGGHLGEVIQTTGTGTGPCNADRALRRAKLARDEPSLKGFLADVPLELNQALDKGMDVLVEGTQGTYLSLYHGTYPYVTSKDVCSSAACSDVGIGPTRVDEVIMVLKSYVTRVGAGELPGELTPEEARRRGWEEYGTVTGRQRRAAPFNYELAKRAAMINGATQIALTKLDTLYPECRGVRDYGSLGQEARGFVESIESQLGLPVTLIGTGPDIEEVIDRR
ncbi:MAG: adenylosuccinate synthetase [Candidatus Bathyarchaeia archaeon]|nr:adenylosuccinate synthetase [Candidatus Bathyarchaeota archaeon]